MKGQLTLLFLFLVNILAAQNPVFQGTPVMTKSSDPVLSEHFTDYEIYSFDSDAMHQALKADENDLQLELHLGDTQFEMYLYPSNIRSQNYVLRVAEQNGVSLVQSEPEIRAYRGELLGDENGYVRLTIDENFLYGTISRGKESFLVEPLHYFDPAAPKDQFVFYRAEDVIPYEGNFCGLTEMQKQIDKLPKGDGHSHDHDHDAHGKPQDGATKTGQCFEIDIAIASDGLMFQKYGSVAAVENHTTGVMNNVAGNWDDDFNDELVYVIVEQFVSTSPSNDPWTSSTNAGTLLNSFTNWGPGGFSVAHDVGSLWTDRNFNGGTIGIAWLSSICTSLRYHCLQDFSSNAQLLRVLTSHELGHNFSAVHDPSGTWIMSPTVNSSNSWSPASTADINAYYPTRPCLSLCPPPVPPVAQFTSNINTLCEGSMVTFYDQSQFGPTSWNWTFPGGTPSSSTDQNPTVTYSSFGSYSVTLQVSNANGSNSITIPGFINVGPVGTDFFFRSDFESGLQGWTVDNPDGQDTWTNEQVGGSREGNRAMKMDNFNYDNQGTRDGLISPTIDLTGRLNVTLEIDYGYVRYNSQFRDSMVVYVSTDNGATFPDRIFAATENGSGNFATAPDNTSDWTPSELDDWCFGGGFGNNCLSLDMSNYEDMNNVKVKIENVNGYGNNMYIDNVRLFSDCEVILPPVADFTGQPTNGCAPLTVNFTDNSQNNPISWVWNMPGAIPPTSTSQNPVVIYTQPGTYDVTLTVTNLAGTNTLTKTAFIQVDGLPEPDFTYSQDSLTYSFTDNTSGTVDTYLWSFGDGNSSSAQNPTHMYEQDGTYQVSLTVVGPCGTNTYSETITVLTPPAPAFSANVTEGCEPLAVQFIDESTNNTTSWNWSFPGGDPATSTMQNPLVLYNSPGTYDVTLTVTNAAGSNSVTQAGFITVNPEPTAGFTFTISDYTVDFSNATLDGDTYLWDFGDGSGSSTDTDPTYTYAQDGVYTVFLYATNDCGTDTLSLDVEVLNLPVPGFTSDVTDGCVPLTVQFFEEASENVDSYEWIFTGGTPASSTLPNPQVTYNSPGTYDVTLIVSNSAGSDALTIPGYITVDDVPDAGFTSSSNDLAVDFTNTSTNADTYLWDFGDGSGSSTESDPSYTYTADGTYTVSMTATNDCGSVTVTETITVSTLPQPAFTADATSGCAPFTVQFFDESSENTTSWNWSFPGGDPASSTAPNPTVTYDTPGTYSVTLTVSNAAGSNSITQTDYITVLDVADASFTESINGLTVDFTNTSQNATSYFWDFGDGMGTSTESDPSYTYGQDGTYTVTLEATNSCGTVTTTETVVIATPPSAGFTFDPATGCAPLTVQFSDNSSANAVSWNWSFPGGTPATSTDQNPVVMYDMAGTYSVTLEVSNAAGTDQVTQTDVIVVNDVADASFTESVNGLTVDFTNTSQNATSYFWDFGDGMGTSTEIDPSYTYGQDGTYTVTLEATNSCGTVTTTETVVIATPPSAGFTFDPATGCAPLTVQFSDNSSANAVSWNWSFPGGTPATSTDQNPVVMYDMAGTYSVTLEVSNAAGTDQVTQTDVIVVNDVADASFTESVNGLTVDFTNTSQNATSYFWDFGDGMGTSTESDPSYTYGQDGTYTVTLEATNPCGTVSTAETIVVATPPSAGFTFDPATGCAPLTVQFSDNSSANAVSWNWSFPGGTPATSTDQNPVVMYDMAGTYSVTLEVSNAAGTDQVTQTDVIVVNDVADASFTESVNGLTVDFTNTSQNATSYFWDFGDGMGTSTEIDPSYSYGQDGTYTVTLEATNPCGTVTTTETVVIVTPPTAAFGSDLQSGCAPLSVQFFNQSSTNAENFFWEFPGGIPATSTVENPVVVYENAGLYSVTLTVTNGAGENSVTQTDNIVVDDVPAAGFTETINGTTVEFINASSNADTYFWDFGDDNTSSEVNPTHTYTEDGIYTVTLIVTNGCGSVTIESTIVIATSGPVALFSSESTEGCAPLSVQFENLSSENAENFLWEFPGGMPATSTDENPVVVYDTPGTYDVSLTAQNGNGSDTYTIPGYITVLGDPTAAFATDVDGSEVSFINNSLDANTYTWFFGDGEESTDSDPVYTYGQVGSYEVMLIAVNDCGADTSTQTVTVEAIIPQAAFSADQTVGCGPLTVQFFDESSGTPTAWEWTFEDGDPATSTEQNPVVTFVTPGVYDVSLMVSNMAGSNQIVQSQYITVIDVPTADFTYVADDFEVTFTNNSTGGTSFAWDFGDNTTSTNPSPSHTYTEEGIYLVVLTVTNACGSSTFEMEIMVGTVSAGEVVGLERFELFPNPNDGRFRVVLESLPGAFGEVELELYNVIGQQIYGQTADFGSGRLEQQFDLPELAKGVYFFRVRLDDRFVVKEVIVQ